MSEFSLHHLVDTAKNQAAKIHERPVFEQFKAGLVGPNGSLTQVMKSMGALAKEDRPAAGKHINEIKQALEAIFAECLTRIDMLEATALLGKPIDPTLPNNFAARGPRHPLAQVRERMVEIFKSIGFSVMDGTRVESEWACFDALNTPADHPARAEQDTYYIPSDVSFSTVEKKGNERLLLRTHTSTVQIRTMLSTPPPIRIVSPGRTFRRDTADATHSANFHQLEGLCVDKNISVKDMKAVLDYFLKSVFGEKVQMRLRPSFFPFTVPSFEVDLCSPNLGKLSNKWVEIFGCGSIDPEVFKNVGYDPAEWSGFAFGMGIERIAMILNEVDDIRHFYNNDLRFLNQFK
jgi:phenylalanyl-tRNA synthetase alpha chain